MEKFYYNHGPWEFEVYNNEDLPDHTFTYELPVTLQNPPHPVNKHCKSVINIDDIVQMPFSLLVHENQGKAYHKQKVVENHWELIKKSLSQSINSSHEMELAIKNYNNKIPEFSALHQFFQKVLNENERVQFFTNLLPKIIKLALKLPELIKINIPILKQGSCSSLSISQLQTSSLLANAFLCTFPWTTGLCPGINFDRLYSSYARPKREKCVLQKLKSLFHYFERITSQEPVGILTFERQHFNEVELPTWDNLNNSIKEMKIHITTDGLIEDDSNGFLQVDFANKNVGGGVLAYGCVQEEIRFIISPELIVSRLFTEQLGPTEALIVTGVERFSNYSGYGDTYTWEGNYQDETPFDPYGRRRISIVAIDAIRFTKAMEQYRLENMLRELNKAYAGFHSKSQKQLSAIATGNWGCGAYKGDPKLKSLLQIMACSACNRDIIYFTFNDDQLCDSIKKMIEFIIKNDITTAQLWTYLCWFSKTKLKPTHLYTFLEYIHLNKGRYPEKEFCNFTVKHMLNTKATNKIVNKEERTDILADSNLSMLFSNL